MDKSDLRDSDNIFIVGITGKSTKAINIPEAVCKFCNLKNGDLIKLKILEVLHKGNNNKK